MRAGVGAILALLLAGPLVAAEGSASGSILAEGSISLPASRMSADLLGAYWDDATGMTELRFEADRARIVVFEFERVDTPLLRQAFVDNTRSYELTNVVLTLAETPRAGWLGHYGGASQVELGASAAALRAGSAALGNAIDPADGVPASTVPVFAVEPTGPFVLATAHGRFAAAGPQSLKLMGPTVRVEASENDTTFWTGTRPSATGVPMQTTSRWILIDTTEGHVVVDAPKPLALAASAVSAEVEGTATFERAHGVVTSGDASYVTEGETAAFTGTLQLQVSPAPSTSTTAIRADVLSGTIAASTIAPAFPASGARDRTALLLVVAGALAVVTTGGLLLHRRTRRTSFTPDQYVDLSYAAADEGRTGDALGWILKARELSPGSSRLLLDEAHLLTRIGDVPAALDRLQQASTLTTDGEPDFHIALVLLETGAAPQEALPAMIRALEKTPSLSLEIASDPLFAPMLALPEGKRAFSHALARSDA